MGYAERDVRMKIKRLWGDGLAWVEQSTGGTVGVPDVFIPMPDGYRLPVELKFWEMTVKGLRCEVRPSQIRYHVMEARAKRKTAFIVGHVNTNMFPDRLHMLIFNGRDVPRENFPKRMPIFRSVSDKADIINAYLSKSFWGE